ncbi:hypothetical protein HU200_018382 [Digitaria exilis]|uniref:Mitotic checkpoint protein BUB3 n=1 Tax=Digitaria exilis TaxID=1010633 RepID=A0A835F6D4_9POAL|nr:hypothetical protein HU200_018382 [Digitaria exilis]
MEFFDLSEAAQSKKYGTFATGGCDGFVNVWDGINKKRLYQVNQVIVTTLGCCCLKSELIPVFMTSLLVTAVLKVCIKHCCSFIQHEPDAIFIRTVNEVEVNQSLRHWLLPSNSNQLLTVSVRWLDELS